MAIARASPSSPSTRVPALPTSSAQCSTATRRPTASVPACPAPSGSWTTSTFNPRRAGNDRHDDEVAAGHLKIDTAFATLPLPGQAESGDLCLIKRGGKGTLVAVVGGLGHGEEAASAVVGAVGCVARDSAAAVGCLG